MKFLKDREEICRALNLMKYPVIMFDLTSSKPGWDRGVYEGSKVRVDTEKTFRDGTPIYRDCRAYIFVDNNHEGIEDTVENRLRADIHLLGDTIGLYDDFKASDVIELAENAQAPVVKAHQKVVVVYKWQTHKGMKAAVRIMEVSTITRHKCPVAMIEDEVA